jgi:hypothetical protein
VITPDEAARRLRHLAGDTEFKINEEDADRQDLLEDLTHRIVSLADELEGRPAEDGDWTPAYELTDWDTLTAGHWV